MPSVLSFNDIRELNMHKLNVLQCQLLQEIREVLVHGGENEQ